MSVSNLQGPGKEPNVPRSVSPKSDTVGAVIERVKAAVNSEGEFTKEQLNDITTYLDLEIAYQNLLKVDPNFRFASDSPAQAPDPQVEAVTGEIALPKSSTDVSEVSPNISSKVALDEQNDKTRSPEAERFEKEAREFNEISKEELQSHLDWMAGDNLSESIENQTRTDNISSSSALSKVKRGFWNAVGYFYPTKK